MSGIVVVRSVGLPDSLFRKISGEFEGHDFIRIGAGNRRAHYHEGNAVDILVSSSHGPTLFWVNAELFQDPQQANFLAELEGNLVILFGQTNGLFAMQLPKWVIGQANNSAGLRKILTCSDLLEMSRIFQRLLKTDTVVNELELVRSSSVRHEFQLRLDLIGRVRMHLIECRVCRRVFEVFVGRVTNFYESPKTLTKKGGDIE